MVKIPPARPGRPGPGPGPGKAGPSKPDAATPGKGTKPPLATATPEKGAKPPPATPTLGANLKSAYAPTAPEAAKQIAAGTPGSGILRSARLFADVKFRPEEDEPEGVPCKIAKFGTVELILLAPSEGARVGQVVLPDGQRISAALFDGKMRSRVPDYPPLTETTLAGAETWRPNFPENLGEILAQLFPQPEPTQPKNNEG